LFVCAARELLISINVNQAGAIRVDLVTSVESAENLLHAAIAAAGGERAALAEALEALDAPVYLTDADGNVTHYNRACVDFAGRVPQIGSDRWCVTWKLTTLDGEPLPHELCPMAVAVKERREVRGAEAFVERPDGTRRRIVPFPTPLYDAQGAFAGAINLVIDVTERRRAEELTAQALRCRRLAASIGDHQAGGTLRSMADEYDAEAERIRRLN